MGTPQIITKLEAAERQLRVAIRLFFEDVDLLAVQALVAGTHEVLSRLSGGSVGGSQLIKNSKFIRPERRKEWVGLVNAVPNFLKHAGKDPDASIEFFPETVQFWIYDCILMHDMITQPHLRESILFMLWFVNQYPQYFEPGAFGIDPQTIAGIGNFEKSLVLEMIENPQKFQAQGK